MSKEEKDGKKQEEEGKEMVVAKKRIKTFSDFLHKNQSKIQRTAEANTTRNKDGDVVITKDDPSRDEHEWTEICKEVDDDS